MLTHVFFPSVTCPVAMDGNKMPVSEGNMGAHTCNSSNQEAEARGQQILGQPKEHSEIQASLSYKARACFKTYDKNT